MRSSTQREVDVDLADEIHAAFAAYRRNGFPEQPDRAMMPGRLTPPDQARWYERPEHAAHWQAMRRAIDAGARGGNGGAVSYHETGLYR